jgi:DNA primase large subunit
VKYIIKQTEKKLIEEITKLSKPNKYIRDFQASKEVMPDIILVSPRHLFRTPYSLHEKTALASVVINPEEIKDFQLKDADPMKVKIKNFMPDAKEGEASELLMQALDWYKEGDSEKKEKKDFNYKPIKLINLSEKNFPPCIQNILKGISDGKKRALFVLINLFRSIGMDRDELEKRIDDWNNKNEYPLKQGYIKSQVLWSYKKNTIMPPNCKEFYQGIGICSPNDFCKLIKNPVNYVIRRNLIDNKKSKDRVKK